MEHITWQRVAMTALAVCAYIGAAYLPDASPGLYGLAGALVGALTPQVGRPK